jgi:hypothetical protein
VIVYFVCVFEDYRGSLYIFLGYFFDGKSSAIILTNLGWAMYTLGVFYKLIWSPCLRYTTLGGDQLEKISLFFQTCFIQISSFQGFLWKRGCNRRDSKRLVKPGANPTIASYNASAENFYNATSSQVPFENKNIISYVQ